MSLLSDQRPVALTCFHSHRRISWAVYTQKTAKLSVTDLILALLTLKESDLRVSVHEVQRNQQCRRRRWSDPNITGWRTIKGKRNKGLSTTLTAVDVFWQCHHSWMPSGCQCLKLHWTWKCLLSKPDDAWWQSRPDEFQKHVRAELRRALGGFPTTSVTNQINCLLAASSTQLYSYTHSLLWARRCTLISIPAGISTAPQWTATLLKAIPQM